MATLRNRRTNFDSIRSFFAVISSVRCWCDNIYVWCVCGWVWAWVGLCVCMFVILVLWIEHACLFDVYLCLPSFVLPLFLLQCKSMGKSLPKCYRSIQLNISSSNANRDDWHKSVFIAIIIATIIANTYVANHYDRNWLKVTKNTAAAKYCHQCIYQNNVFFEQTFGK